MLCISLRCLFFGAYICQYTLNLTAWSGIALTEIACCRTDLTVGSAKHHKDITKRKKISSLIMDFYHTFWLNEDDLFDKREKCFVFGSLAQVGSGKDGEACAYLAFD